ncbi:(2Fe-2S)-binding protein [Pseudonocardia acidicola]|uniref:(2Fe-2S)-binding protein n=1 Tax=Pseudonocardia acidicola TaxID=2724939 RepID=A0ABX1SAI7_9PSEU|nr:(2Fe-2S)-binding protein [Pseudonocardia acidicola]NMH97488.1 (2Fe-2S)-binding protein [Pseudonocardia acidicola]
MSVAETPDPTGTAPARRLTLTVNGRPREVSCEDRQLLVEVIREQLNLKGTHVGCLNGDCGACTVELDGRIVKSCLLLAASAEGAEITTVDAMGSPGDLSPIQEAFWDNDGFQCGFCLPGHLFAARELIRSHPDPSDDEIRQAIAGNLCRCTGYQRIVASIRDAAARVRGCAAAGES